MAIVGDLSGSQANNHVIGMTGSVVIGRPFGDTGLASNLPGLPGNDVVLFVSGNIDGRQKNSGRSAHGVAVFGGDIVTSGCMTLEPIAAPTTTTAKLYNVDGTLTWAGGAIAATTPGGSDTQVQYNNGGAFGGAADLTFNDSTGDITVGASTGDAKLFFRDAGNYIYSNADGDLDIINADGTAANSINIDCAAGGVVIDAGKTGVGVLLLTASHAAGGVRIDSGTGDIDINSDDAIDIDLVGAFTVDSSGGAVSIQGAAASDLTTSAGALTLEGKTGVLIKEDGTTAIEVTNDRAVNLSVAGQATTVKGTFNVDQAASFDSTVTVSGDMIVLGNTTTVSSSNMIVKDPIVALGIASSSVSGGSLTLGPAGDRGFVFPMDGAYNGSPVLFWDHAGITSGVAMGAFSFSRAAVSATGSLNTITTSSLADVMAGVVYHADTNSSHGLGIKWNEGDTSNRILNLKVEGGDRTLHLHEGLTVGDGHVGTLTFSAASKTLTIENTSVLNQDLTSDAAVTFASITADGGVAIDNITIDGTEIDLSSGDLTLDVAGDIVLDADGGDVFFKDAGVAFLTVTNSSTDVILSASAGGKDMIFHGNEAEVFRLDSTAASLLVASGKKVELGGTANFFVGSTSLTGSSTADILLDATKDIFLDADGGQIMFADGGTVSVTVDMANNVIFPTSDAAVDLGKVDKRFQNIYTADLHLANDRGNWTLVEESDMLTFRNNKTGKWYRMGMEEIDPTGRDKGMKGAPPLAMDDDVAWEL